MHIEATEHKIFSALCFAPGVVVHAAVLGSGDEIAGGVPPDAA